MSETTQAQLIVNNGNLLQRFAALVAAFDASPSPPDDQTKQTISGLLDPNVMLTSLDPPRTTYQGIDSVMNYLVKNVLGNARFYPTTTEPNSETGAVMGKATWIDGDTGSSGETIHYSFVFVKHVSDGNLYCVNLWGTSP